MKYDYIEKIYDVNEPPPENIQIPLIGICVSYCYFDTLQFMLPVNYLHFNKIYIITQENDIETIEFSKKFKNVVILFYNFKNNDKRFDKYGAIKYAQQKIYNEHPNSWYLIIDSDILLPNNFINILINEKLNEECIYGAYRLNIFKTSELFRKNLFIERNENLHSNNSNNILYRKKYPPSILGCFQLYKKKCYQPDNFNNAGWGDYQFGYDNFNLFCNLQNLIYIHLGEGNKNWNGKLVPFTNDCIMKLNNLYFNCNINCKNIYYDNNCVMVNNGYTSYTISNNNDLTSSQDFCRDILNFYYGKKIYKIIEVGTSDKYTREFLSNIFSKVYVIEKIDLINNVEKTNDVNLTNVEYINSDISKDNFNLLPSDVDIVLLYLTNSYKDDMENILNYIVKFEHLKYIIFGCISKLDNNDNLIIDELVDQKVLIFERFIGISDIINGKYVHEGIICSVNTNYIKNNNNVNNRDNNILIIKNKSYTWEDGVITFLNYLQLDTTFGEGTYSIIDLYTFQVNFRNKQHILVFNDDYTEFKSTRMDDNNIVKGKLIIFNENILEDKTYTWMNTSITFYKNGNMKAFGRGKYSKINEFTFQVKFGGKEYIFIFNNRFTEFIAKRDDDNTIIKGRIVLFVANILAFNTYSWNNKTITFLENGEMSPYGKGNYIQSDIFTFKVNFWDREYIFVFNNDYTEYTATRLDDKLIIKGKIILNSNVIQDKTYSWGNKSITFLKDGKMNGFGKGEYKQIDAYTFRAKFGFKVHKIIFNHNYTEFTATRMNDKLVVNGKLISNNLNKEVIPNVKNKVINSDKEIISNRIYNKPIVKNKIISNTKNIEDKTYSWGGRSISFLQNGQMNAFGKGKYKQIDSYTFEANFGNKKHILKFNNDYTEFTSTRVSDNVNVTCKQISDKAFISNRIYNNRNVKNKVISNTKMIENNTYLWGNQKISFLKGNKMNAFGKGNYRQIDSYTFEAIFGNKKHILKFNNDYTEFTSTRVSDNVNVKCSLLLQK